MAFKNIAPLSLLRASDFLKNKSHSLFFEQHDRFGVLGFPIAHSASPIFQNAALQALQLPYRYRAIEVKPEELAETLLYLKELGFLGLNITLPHKQAVLEYLDEISEHATFLGAVNTIVMRNGKLIGHNTDGPGFVAALQETWSMSLAKQRVLILGASGGAGRAIAAQCVLEKCQELYLASRTPSMLETQLQSFSQHDAGTMPMKILSLHHDALATIMPQVDLIINATSVGMNQNDEPLFAATLFQPHHFFYDTIYSSGETALMRAASNAGARVANGRSMLLHQGALSFELWFERPAPLEVMRKALFQEKEYLSKDTTFSYAQDSDVKEMSKLIFERHASLMKKLAQ